MRRESGQKRAGAWLRLGAGETLPAGTLVAGWADPEDGFVWSLGRESRFRLPAAAFARPALLELDLNPFALPGSSAGQRLSVLVNGTEIGSDQIVGEGVIGYEVPSALLGHGPATVTLRHPDSRRPADLGFNDDRRELGFMLRRARLMPMPEQPSVAPRATPLPPLALPATTDSSVLRPLLPGLAGLSSEDLAQAFESLGHNCEFGLVQRHCGIEPLGLLRFSSITLPDLRDGLDRGFAGLGTDTQVEAFLSQGARREFLVRDMQHRVSIHTLRFEDETDRETVRRDQARQMRFFHRKFMEVLQTGERIFVFQRPGQTLLAQIRPLLAALRRHGLNALLFVTDDPAHPPGTVEQLGYGLFRGFIDRMAPLENAGDTNLSAWLSLCVNARRLWSAQLAETGDTRSL